MCSLGEIPEIERNICNAAIAIVKALFLICFGHEGNKYTRRRELRKFAGFDWDKESEEHVSKISETMEKLTLADLIGVCGILHLPYQGEAHDLAKRICDFLCKPGTTKILDSDDEDDDDDDDDDSRLSKNKYDAVNRCNFSLTFRDVENSIREFTGKDNYSINRWIEDFEEVAALTNWTELQMLLFAKRSLAGLAKLFVQSQSGIRSWKTLKERLIDEFQVQTSSAQIHKMLCNRKRKYSESIYEYILCMRELGSRAHIDDESIIQYIIDGIGDSSGNKIVLYGARNFHEFKEKARIYEQVSKNDASGKYPKIDGRRPGYKPELAKFSQLKNTKQTVKVEGFSGRSAHEQKCFNCGNSGHMSRDCPQKQRGTKCFKCQKFGHIATNCTVEKKREDTANVAAIESVPVNSVELDLGTVKIDALFDTGSDISIIREDVYRKYLHTHPLVEDSLIIRGLGHYKMTALGSIRLNVGIGSYSYDLKFYVMGKESSGFRAILGSNILQQAKVEVDKDGVVVRPRLQSNREFSWLMNIVPNDREDELEVNHIEDNNVRVDVLKMVKGYNPKKTEQADIKMKIILKCEDPVYQRARRLSLPEQQEVDKQISEWLEEGIIRESSSDFASPIVLVSKKDGSKRLCCDYRRLNKNIVKDRFPLPLIEDVMDGLEGANYFTTIDLRNGFFHVDVDEDSIKYTSFITPTGQYEFLKCPFGLCNSPAVFQRYINFVFRPLIRGKTLIYYMDDLIIPSISEIEGLEKLEKVLDVASRYGLDIKTEKCQFLKKRVNFLGYIVENGKIQPSDEKTKAIKNFPEPKTIKQVQSFLGLTGYFRKFISSYSLIAKPLSDLLKSNNRFEFGGEQRWSFGKLKDLLSSSPVLNIFQRGAPTQLHTDASMHGYGACLMQVSNVDGKLHPVYYFSKKTTPAEEKYSSYELEVLAVITAVKKFRVYLLGFPFKIITDCSAFQKTLQKKELSTRVARWALLLEEYDYEVEHRKGTGMRHVDALSRYPVVMTILEENGCVEKMKLAQNKDERIRVIRELLESKGEYDGYMEKHGLLHKYVGGNELLVVPTSMQSEVIRKIHDDGHFGTKKTEEIVRREFHIPKLKEKILKVITNCIKCILVNRKEGKQEGLLHPIPKLDGPLHTYHVDHLGPIPSTSKNYQHILVIVDHFTKFVWLYPVKSTTTKETLNCLARQQKVFGNPARIITDKGTAFTSTEFRDYCEGEGIVHITITTGVPRGNGQVERMNRTIIPVFAKLSADEPTKWFKYTDRVQRAINSSYQRSIDATPFELLMGVRMRKKEDLKISEILEREIKKTFSDEREELRKNAKEQLLKVQEENKSRYNLRRKEPTKYKEGELVAIKRTQFGTGLKFAAKFLGPYEILKVKPNERYDVIKVGYHEGPTRTSTCAEFMKRWVDSDFECESEADSN